MIFHFSKIGYFSIALNSYVIGEITSKGEGEAINKNNEESVVITGACVSTHFFFLPLKYAVQLFIHEVKEMVIKEVGYRLFSH